MGPFQNPFRLDGEPPPGAARGAMGRTVTALSPPSPGKRPSSFVVTANRLADGRVVYLGSNFRWTPHLAKARVAENDGEREALERRASRDEAARIVVAAYSFAVALAEGVPLPLTTRERIRAAHGPSPEGARRAGGGA